MNTAHCLEFILRSFAVSALACLMIAAFRRASRQVRMAVTLSAWAVMALVAVDFIVPLPRLPLWTAVREEVGGALVSSANHAVLPVWWAGTLALLAREVLGVIRLRKMIRESEPNIESTWLREIESGCAALGLDTPWNCDGAIDSAHVPPAGLSQ